MRTNKLLLAPAAALLAGMGFALALLATAAAGSGAHTLNVLRDVKDSRQGNKLVTAVVYHGLAVYYLSGESKRHALCTKADGCFSVWRPVRVRSRSKLSKAAGISGKLGLWNRHGFHQVTLGGKPLYTFASDTKGMAGGDGVASFGGTWHLVTLSSGGGTTSSGTTSPNPSTTTTTTTTTCLYPPCY